MIDHCIEIGDSRIQYGPHSDRVYLIRPGSGDWESQVQTLEELSRTGRHTKIVARIPRGGLAAFEARGFEREACIPGLFRGTTGFMVAKFTDPSRRVPRDPARIREILADALAAPPCRPAPPEPVYRIRKAGPEDAPALAALYRTVFASYPFPILDPEYLLKVMRGDTEYWLALENGTVLAAASAEKDGHTRSAELTDFATLPSCRGRRLSRILLGTLEEQMRGQGMLTVYTIARALSPPINRLFSGARYLFCGTLVNNTHICGRIESMHVWSKRLGS